MEKYTRISSGFQKPSLSHLKTDDVFQTNFVPAQKTMQLTSNSNVNFMPRISSEFGKISQMAISLTILTAAAYKLLRIRRSFNIQTIPIFVRNGVNNPYRLSSSKPVILKLDNIDEKKLLKEYEGRFKRYDGDFGPLTTEDSKKRSLINGLVEFITDLLKGHKNSTLN